MAYVALLNTTLCAVTEKSLLEMIEPDKIFLLTVTCDRFHRKTRQKNVSIKTDWGVDGTHIAGLTTAATIESATTARTTTAEPPAEAATEATTTAGGTTTTTTARGAVTGQQSVHAE